MWFTLSYSRLSLNYSVNQWHSTHFVLLLTLFCLSRSFASSHFPLAVRNPLHCVCIRCQVMSIDCILGCKSVWLNAMNGRRGAHDKSPICHHVCLIKRVLNLVLSTELSIQGGFIGVVRFPWIFWDKTDGYALKTYCKFRSSKCSL